MNLSAFKAYDVRGRIPDEINEELARAIGRAYAGFVKAKHVVVGRDIRLTSATLADALIEGCWRVGSRSRISDSAVRRVVFRDGQGRPCLPAQAVMRREAFDGGIMVTAQPQPARLQRHEVRARGLPAGQQRYRSAGRWQL
jgi:phosphomannomutase